MKEVKEFHQHGMITFEGIPGKEMIIGDLGLQVAVDGRIWLCVNGAAFIRFKPLKIKKESR